METRIRGCIFAILLTALPLGAQTAREIVERSRIFDEENRVAARNYTFRERVEDRDVDSNGQVKSRSTKTFEIMFLDGEPHSRLVAKDDKPLPASEEAKEERKMQEALDKRRKLSPEQRAKKDAEREKNRQEDQKLFREIPKAFHFELLREEKLGGRDTWVLSATPKQGYKPSISNGKYLTKFRGTLWVDKQSYRWAKVEAETLDNISFGLFIAKLDKGSHFEFEQMQINNEVWLPKRVTTTLSARLAFKKLRKQIETSFSDYRKFQSDSRIVSTAQPIE